MESDREALEKQGFTFVESTEAIPSIDSDDASYVKITVKYRGRFLLLLAAETPEQAWRSALLLADAYEPSPTPAPAA